MKKFIKHITLSMATLWMIVGINDNVWGDSEMTNKETLVVSMGCFWCAESEFRNENSELLNGIIDLKVGYASEKKDLANHNPTYKNHEGYTEALKITYDPQKISYKELLDIFWKNIDPFDDKGQFCDKGAPYIAAIFYNDDAEKIQILDSLKKIKNYFQNKKEFMEEEIKTKILPYGVFFNAEEYHQNYKLKNPLSYKYYRWNCGRDQRLKKIWE